MYVHKDMYTYIDKYHAFFLQTHIDIYIYTHIPRVYIYAYHLPSQLQHLPVRISHPWDEDPKTLRRGVGRGKSTIRSVGELKDGFRWGRWGGLVSN